MIAQASMVSGIFDVEVVEHEPRPAVRATPADLAAIGATRWASPPPGLSRNSVYILQLVMVAAALLVLLGERMAGG